MNLLANFLAVFGWIRLSLFSRMMSYTKRTAEDLVRIS